MILALLVQSSRRASNKINFRTERNWRKNFNTASANINFAVPNRLTLQQIGKTKHSSIPPSIFHPVLETILTSVQNTPKEFILSFDGKSVGPGLKDQNEGDVDLWNFESNLNLNDEKE